MRISFGTNGDRDLACLLLRHFHAQFNLQPDKVRNFGERDFYKKREQMLAKTISELHEKIEAAKTKKEEYDFMQT